MHCASKSDQKLAVICSGPLSPLHSIEPLVVGIILERATMRQLIRVSEGIALVNLMIEGTKLEEDFVKWKRATNPSLSIDEKVGRNYWQSFTKQYEAILLSKKSVTYDRK